MSRRVSSAPSLQAALRGRYVRDSGKRHIVDPIQMNASAAGVLRLESTLMNDMDSHRRIVIAPDKFRGTMSASAAAVAMAEGARTVGATAVERPLADGGEGTLDAFGGGNRHSTVTGPLGAPVDAEWRLVGDLAVIEMARASGLSVVGGRDRNDPLKATTQGTGELIAEAIAAGARRIIVGVGGSATTDGGLGAIDALHHRRFSLDSVAVEIACDVTTHFVDAARVYGPQKGADARAVAELTTRLRSLARRYLDEFGVDVTATPRAGAAGGLAGGLLALGASLEGGFDLIADAVDLDLDLEHADFVITGEGRLDETSFTGKVVGGVLSRCERSGVTAAIVAGSVVSGLRVLVDAISLVDRYGERRAFHDTAACLRDAAIAILSS
jgi:glycerate 2-kinase